MLCKLCLHPAKMCCEAEQLMEHCSADAVKKIKERSTAPCTEAGHWADPLSANNVCSQRVRVCVCVWRSNVPPKECGNGTRQQHACSVTIL